MKRVAKWLHRIKNKFNNLLCIYKYNYENIKPNLYPYLIADNTHNRAAKNKQWLFPPKTGSCFRRAANAYRLVGFN
jgi:hypothetical protein